MQARIPQALRYLHLVNRDSRFRGRALGLALALLCMAPVTPAQSQSQSQETQNQTQSKGESQSGAQSQPQSQSQQKTDSLVEASRKAKAQKAKSAPAKVYTEDDVSNLTSRGVSIVGGGDATEGSASTDDSNASAAGQGTGQSAGQGASGTGKDEAYWRGRAHQIQSQIAAVDDEIEKTQDDIKKNGAVSIDPNSGYQQAVILVHDRNEQLKELEAQKEKLQQQMEALEEEGRKAGADAGWFR